MSGDAVIEAFVSRLKLAAERGEGLELSREDTWQLSRALEDYCFDEAREITRDEVDSIISDAVEEAIRGIDITEPCLERIFGNVKRRRR